MTIVEVWYGSDSSRLSQYPFSSFLLTGSGIIVSDEISCFPASLADKCD